MTVKEAILMLAVYVFGVVLGIMYERLQGQKTRFLNGYCDRAFGRAYKHCSKEEKRIANATYSQFLRKQ